METNVLKFCLLTVTKPNAAQQKFQVASKSSSQKQELMESMKFDEICAFCTPLDPLLDLLGRGRFC